MGREKGLRVIAKHQEKLKLEIFKSAKRTNAALKPSRELAKLICAILYWGEGEKSESAIAFTNSDPIMVKLFINLFKKSFNTQKQKFRAFLHLHNYHNRKKQLEYWAKITGIPNTSIKVYNKTSVHKTIKPGYQGCISIRYYDARIAKEIKYLYTEFARKLGGLV